MGMREEGKREKEGRDIGKEVEEERKEWRESVGRRLKLPLLKPRVRGVTDEGVGGARVQEKESHPPTPPHPERTPWASPLSHSNASSQAHALVAA